MREFLWRVVSNLYIAYLRVGFGMDIAKTARVSYKAILDKSINPKGIHIGEYSMILANATILAHDHCRKIKTNTYIGSNSVIGINAIIMPGIKIGDHVVIGSGSVVTKDVPSHCIAVGNPAKIIKENIYLNNKGQII